MIPLSMVDEGKEVRVACLRCGRGLAKRLTELGMCNEVKVKVVKNDLAGPLIVKVLDSKIAIGRGQAQKIMVKPVQSSK